LIEPGSQAPNFTLPDQDGNAVGLGDFSGRRLVVAFYPGDFSSVCSDQLSVYQEVLGEIEARGAALVGISVDSADSHRAFREQLGLAMPLLADFHPKGEVCRAYGTYSEDYGKSGRALVLIDEEGAVSWSHESPPLEVPGANLIFDALSGE
jgi:peroxiredoxin